MPGHSSAIFRSGRRKGSALLFAFAFASIAGCHSKLATAQPTIEITHAPIASLGGPDRMDDIDGHVTGARAGQQIVLYAHSGVWWVQPLTNQPYTRIAPDETWKNATHYGTEYAALLVDPGYRPASKLVSLPSEGDGVAAVAVFKGKSETASARTVLHFSGYDWTVRAAGSDHGGEPDAYDPANAWTDEKGFLHLRMTERDGRWTCAELSLDRSLGYGTYEFVVQDSAHLNPSAVLSMFTWDDRLSEGNRNELRHRTQPLGCSEWQERTVCRSALLSSGKPVSLYRSRRAPDAHISVEARQGYLPDFPRLSVGTRSQTTE